MNNLFSPAKIRNTAIKNRIVMPPMVSFGFGGDDGQITEKHLSHYEARAKGGVGLIIIDKAGRLSPNQLGLWSDEQILGFSRLAEICHQYGAKVLVQIHHAGLAAHKSVTNALVAPSDYQGKMRDGVITARALTSAEIRALQSKFVATARRAQKAGLDGIELHCAHGFLISQFFSPLVNKRTDTYGGSLDNRVRFVAEIIARIRQAVGNDFIIGCRIGCGEPDLETSIEIAKILGKSGVDLLHVSTGFGSPQDKGPAVPEGFEYNWIVYGGTEIKKHISVPVIVVNGIRTPEQAAYLVEQGLADFTAIGTGLLIDPEWANKALNHKPIIPCINCRPCKLFEPGGVCVQLKSTKKKT
jgi:2,4-dienoyl-CoA reductase-like NADH-dependent reductase (Old Yellow Enzyme family)